MLERFQKSLTYDESKSLFCVHEAMLSDLGISYTLLDKYGQYVYFTVARGFSESDRSLIDRTAKDALINIIELTRRPINKSVSKDIWEELSTLVYAIEDTTNNEG